MKQTPARLSCGGFPGRGTGPGGGAVLPYMGFLGMCRGIRHSMVFKDSRSLNRVPSRHTIIRNLWEYPSPREGFGTPNKSPDTAGLEAESTRFTIKFSFIYKVYD